MCLYVCACVYDSLCVYLCVQVCMHVSVRKLLLILVSSSCGHPRNYATSIGYLSSNLYLSPYELFDTSLESYISVDLKFLFFRCHCYQFLLTSAVFSSTFCKIPHVTSCDVNWRHIASKSVKHFSSVNTILEKVVTVFLRQLDDLWRSYWSKSTNHQKFWYRKM